MRVTILRTGDAIPSVAELHGEFADWIRSAIPSPPAIDWNVIDVRVDDSLPEPTRETAYIITGSSHSVTERAPWMARTETFVRRAVERRSPLLGICFGHQLIANALGGRVGKNANGREIGSVRVEIVDHDNALFSAISPTFDAHATHEDSVVELPRGARLLARTPREPVASFAFGSTTYGVQFHPEFNSEIMRGYVRARAHLIRGEGLDADAILGGVRDAPVASTVLSRFVSARLSGGVPSD